VESIEGSEDPFADPPSVSPAKPPPVSRRGGGGGRGRRGKRSSKAHYKGSQPAMPVAPSPLATSDQLPLIPPQEKLLNGK